MREKTFYKRRFNDENIDPLRTRLAENSWKRITNTADANRAYD